MKKFLSACFVLAFLGATGALFTGCMPENETPPPPQDPPLSEAQLEEAVELVRFVHHFHEANELPCEFDALDQEEEFCVPTNNIGNAGQIISNMFTSAITCADPCTRVITLEIEPLNQACFRSTTVEDTTRTINGHKYKAKHSITCTREGDGSGEEGDGGN